MDTTLKTTYIDNSNRGVIYLVLENEIFFSNIEPGQSTLEMDGNAFAAICQAEGIEQDGYTFYVFEMNSRGLDPNYEPSLRGLCRFYKKKGDYKWYWIGRSFQEPIHRRERTENVTIAIAAFQNCIEQKIAEKQNLRAFLLKKHNLTEEEAAQYSTEFILESQHYHIDQSLWGNPGLYTYVNSLIRTEVLQRDLSSAYARKSGCWISRPSEGHILADEEVYTDDFAMRKAGLKENDTHFFRPANVLTARNAYLWAELLMCCVITILQDGLAGSKKGKDYIKRKANKALAAYGLEVVDKTTE